jgi:ribulose-phosphate 3-epimerase
LFREGINTLTGGIVTNFSKVVPAILVDDPAALESMVRQAETYTDYVQVDMMDGQFVPSRSIALEHLADLQPKLEWEAHIMVLHPEDYLDGLYKAGAQRVVFHYESTSSPREVISRMRDLGLGVGLAVSPETPVADVLPLANEVDSVLFLSVHPGFYGAPFLPEVLDKIKEFRSARPGVETGIDGGVKEHNIMSIARTGVDLIYVGSAILLQPDPAESFRRLSALAEEGSQ